MTDATPLASEQITVPGTLWCVHTIGPDDVNAAPDFDTAERWAANQNRMVREYTKARGMEHDPHWPLVRSVVAIWPHSAEAHAIDLPASIVAFSASNDPLSATPAPSGWKLVPIKPTVAMIDAGMEGNPTMWTDETDSGFGADVANDVYAAMIEAAPAPSDQDASQAQGEAAKPMWSMEDYDAFVTFEGWLTEYRRSMDADILHSWAADMVQSGKALLAIRDRVLNILSPAPGATAQDGVERLTARIAEVMDDDGGCWSPCSGCQESNEGYVSERDYPYSALFKCQPGGGCHECGGIGVLWQDGAFLASYGDALSETPTPTIPAGMVDALSKAYAAGAEEVHSYWKQCRPDVVFESEPDFTEASLDYGRQAAEEALAAAPKQAEQQGVERIARLLCEQHGGDPDAVASEPHDCWEGPLWTAFQTDALAILAALNAPTGAVEKGEAM